jgi:hypothetical protein
VFRDSRVEKTSFGSRAALHHSTAYQETERARRNKSFNPMRSTIQMPSRNPAGRGEVRGPSQGSSDAAQYERRQRAPDRWSWRLFHTDDVDLLPLAWCCKLPRSRNGSYRIVTVSGLPSLFDVAQKQMCHGLAKELHIGVAIALRCNLTLRNMTFS